MDKDKYRSHNEKMRSSLDSGDYRSAQRTAGSFAGDLLSDIFDGISGFFSSRREAKERERERQEQLRREREAAERRRKIVKVMFIIILVAGVGTGGFFLVKSILFGKPASVVEKTIDVIEIEPAIIEKAVPEKAETIETDSIDIEPVDKKSLFQTIGEYFMVKTLTVKNFFGNELFPKIADIPHSDNLLYVAGYSLIALWLGLGALFLLAFFGKAFMALFNKKNWGKAGSILLSSGLLFTSDVILYYGFRNVLESQLTGTLFNKILIIIPFAIFIFANITIMVMLSAKNKKAKWGTVIKMIIAIVAIYIPILLLNGKNG